MRITIIVVAIVSLTLALSVVMSAQTEKKTNSGITDRTVTLQTEKAAQDAKKRADKEQSAANPGKQPNITDRTVTVTQQSKQPASDSSKKGNQNQKKTPAGKAGTASKGRK